MSTKKVVVIGGGSGTFVTLSALKNYPVKLSAVVSMIDSGGSTGRLRDQLGVLPPGDIRQALVALSEEGKIWRDLFTYRFESGDLTGHTFGNIFLATVEKIAESLPKAVEMSQKLLKTKGDILPVTLNKSTLFAELEDGTVVEGEANIDELGKNWKLPVQKIMRCWIAPKACATTKALRAIRTADFIIVGPGDLHTSILPNFLVDGVSEAIVDSSAKKIFIVNLMTKRGQTDNFKAGDFLKEIKKCAKKLIFDYIIINNGNIEKSVVGWYQKTSEVGPVLNDLRETNRTKIIVSDVVSTTVFGKTVSDRIERSLIRHDPKKLDLILRDLITD
jgi:uncharacterized cofD-like protein